MNTETEIPAGTIDGLNPKAHQNILVALIRAKRLSAFAGFLIGFGTLLISYMGYTLTKQAAAADHNRSVEEDRRAQLMLDANVLSAVAQISATQRMFFTHESDTLVTSMVKAIKNNEAPTPAMETAARQQLSFYEEVAGIRGTMKSTELQSIIDGLHRDPARNEFNSLKPWIVTFRAIDKDHASAWADLEDWIK